MKLYQILGLALNLVPVGGSIISCRTASHSATPEHTLPVSARAVQPAAMSALSSAITVPDAATLAIIHVRALPGYKRAQLACAGKNYVHAANLLLELSRTPGLSQDESKFCLTQVNVCRRDAGLPAFPGDHGSGTKVQALPEPLRVPPAAQRKTPNTKRLESSDCGPRALAFACSQLGVRSDLAALCKAAGTTKDGTTMEGLAKAAQSLGLKAEGIQTGRDALPQIQMPAVAWYKGSHYIAVLILRGGPGDAGTAVIHDPNDPTETTLSQENLLRRSGGYLLLIHR